MREELVYKTSETAEKSVEIIDIRLEVKRGPLILRAKSPLIEEWVKSNHDIKGDTEFWGYKLRGLTKGFYPEGRPYFLNWSSNTLLDNKLVNLTWLRAVGLGEGITIKFPGFYTDAMRVDLKNALQTGIFALYKDYFKPWDAELKIWSQLQEGL